MPIDKDYGNDLVKNGWCYRGPIKDWETRLYRYELASGYGDFIGINCKMIMKTEDKSDWALDLFSWCKFLLRKRLRWPCFIQIFIAEEHQCKTRLCSLYNKTKQRWGKRRNERRVKNGKSKIQTHCKYRSRSDMTRDPYISGIACAMFLEDMDFINEISIPYYLWRAPTWTWHKYLKDPTDRNYKKWKRAERIASWFKINNVAGSLIMQRREAVEAFDKLKTK